MDSFWRERMGAATVACELRGSRRGIRRRNFRRRRAHPGGFRTRLSISPRGNSTHERSRSQSTSQCSAIGRVHYQGGEEFRSQKSLAVVRVRRKSGTKADYEITEGAIEHIARPFSFRLQREVTSSFPLLPLAGR